MKKALCAAAVIAALCVPSFGAVKVIPYPPEAETKIDGASAAPAEINHKGSAYFDTGIDFYEAVSTDSRIILKNYPTYQQTTEYTCGPAAALTVLYYYGVEKYDEASLAVEMKTQGYPIGTKPKDMLAFFERIGWKTQSNKTHPRFEEFTDFMKFARETLSAGVPILIDNVEWGGHWRVIIGYDTMNTENTLDDVIITADPYDTSDHKQDGYAVSNAERFYSMWFTHDTPPEEQVFIAAHP